MRNLMKTLRFFLTSLSLVLLASTVAFAQGGKKRVAVLPVENKAKIDSASLLYLTDQIRNAARMELPSDRFELMDKQNMQVLLGKGKKLAA